MRASVCRGRIGCLGLWQNRAMKAKYFKSPAEFRQWLEANHDRVMKLWVGFYKKDSGRGGITYAEAVDEALCFGWIDGLKKRVDEWSYTHRFSPRKPRSIWSLINIRRAEELKKLGRMKPAGLKAVEARDPKRSGIYSFENRPRKLDAALEKKFRADKKAWTFFQAQPPGCQRVACWYVMSAKREETRMRRLARLVSDSGDGRRLATIAGEAKQPK